MAELTITASNIIPVSGYTPYDGIAGATITAGQACYLDEAAGTIKLSDSNGAAALKTVKGVSIHAALAGQPIRLIVGGSLGMGAILTAGTFYYLSETAGAICLFSDLASGEVVSQIGYASTTSNLVMNIVNTGITL